MEQYAYRVSEQRPVLSKKSGVSSGGNDATTATSIVWKHDNDDDGEDGAGKRLAQLLELRNEDGVLILVSRWYGGIQLGPKRFAHIASTAQALLVASLSSPSSTRPTTK
jgi:putative IMPACT (imprinted ancient) family translation regulator